MIAWNHIYLFLNAITERRQVNLYVLKKILADCVARTYSACGIYMRVHKRD